MLICSRLQNLCIKLYTWVAILYLAAFYTMPMCWPVWDSNEINWNQVFWDSCDNKNEFLVETNIFFGIKRAWEEATEYNKEVVKKGKYNYIKEY